MRVRPHLVCPACRGELRDVEDGLACPACALRYPVVDGVPWMIAEEAGAWSEGPPGVAATGDPR
ncbi:MAG: Trm112 family protein [Alphaproteobacteria bacterium]|nr:Trm112 family protein [Alphaproteobacteria bacterium]